MRDHGWLRRAQTFSLQFPYAPERSDSESQSSSSAADQLVHEVRPAGFEHAAHDLPVSSRGVCSPPPPPRVSGGLASLAQDPTFVSQTEEEMADAMHTTLDDMESVARVILSQRSGPIPPAKKKRAVPLPPAPPPPPRTPQGTAPPDPSVRRKRRPVAIIPSSRGLSGSNS